jgi:hypothetical protein
MEEIHHGSLYENSLNGCFDADDVQAAKILFNNCWISCTIRQCYLPTKMTERFELTSIIGVNHIRGINLSQQEEARLNQKPMKG